MLILKKITILFLLTIIGISSSVAFANEEVSDKDMQLFVKAIKLMQAVEMEAQQKMINAVEEAGLDVQSYNELQQTLQDPDQAENISEEDKQKFNTATRAIQQIQLETQTELEKQIGEAGLTVEKYQEIGTIIQGDPELQQKVQEMLQ